MIHILINSFTVSIVASIIFKKMEECEKSEIIKKSKNTIKHNLSARVHLSIFRQYSIPHRNDSLIKHVCNLFRKSDNRVVLRVIVLRVYNLKI